MSPLPGAFLIALGICLPAAASDTRVFTDSAAREVEVPADIDSVYPTGHPASILLYSLAPELLLGWTREQPEEASAFMTARAAGLPVIGRLGGRGDTANLERVLKLGPDLLLDYGAVREPYTSMADRLQEQTGIPVVLLDGRFEAVPTAYRKLGELLGRPEAAERLAAYAADTMSMAERVVESVPEEERPQVYYGRNGDGLTTAFAGSLNAEILAIAGARNVARGSEEPGLGKIGMEQVLSWNPEVILTINRNFIESAPKDPVWQQIEAVRRSRVYLAPDLPFGWFDRPPSVNRLIGVRWLLHLFYPERMDGSLQDEVRRFYDLFYHVALEEEQLDRLLERALP